MAADSQQQRWAIHPDDDLRLELGGSDHFKPRFEAQGPGRRHIRAVLVLNMRRLGLTNLALGFMHADTALRELQVRLAAELTAAREEHRGSVDLAVGQQQGGSYAVLIDADYPRQVDVIAGRCHRTDMEPCGDPPLLVEWSATLVVSDPIANSLALAERAFAEHRRSREREGTQLYVPAWHVSGPPRPDQQ